MLRARALSQGDYAVKVQDFLGGSHLDLQAATAEDLSDQVVLNKLKSVIGIEKDVDYSLESILYQVSASQSQHQENIPRVKDVREAELCQKLEQWTVEPAKTIADIQMSSEDDESLPRVHINEN